MSQKGTKRYEESRNKDFESLGDDRIPEPNSDLGKRKGEEKVAVLRDREDSDVEVNDRTGEPIAKENTASTKNYEAKLRTTSDKEC